MISLLPIFLVSLIVIVVASEVGRWLGVRAGTRGEENVLTLEGAVLGLVALMIGFTFATQIIVEQQSTAFCLIF
jgi:hypothetical protein